MPRTVFLLLPLLVLPLVLSPWTALAADHGLERYPIPGHGTLVFDEPHAWQAKLVQPADDGPPTIVLYPLQDQRFQLFITVFWHDGFDRDVTSRKAIRALVEKVGQAVLKMSDQSTLSVKPIPGLKQPGFMYDLDDSSAGEDEFSHVAQGALAVGDLVVSFTLLTHQAGSADERAVLDMLRSARQLGGASGVGRWARRSTHALPVRVRPAGMSGRIECTVQ